MRSRAKEMARKRLARMGGQVRGLLSMVETDRETIEILNQVAALRAALEGFGSLVLTDHVEEIIAPPAGSKMADQTVTERVDRVREALSRMIK